MATYSKEDFERIAVAVRKDVADVMRHEKSFEAVAIWYRLNSQAPKAPDDVAPSANSKKEKEKEKEKAPTRIAPSVMSKKMKQIAKDARRLLKNLGVPHDEFRVIKIEDAYDGPGDFEILKVLSWAVDHDEDPVITATRRIGRLVEVIEAIEAANDLEQWAEYAADEVIKFGQLTVPKGHHGEAAVNTWIAHIMPVYKQITGKEPGTSVGAPGNALQRKAGGPLIRFLASAEKPLGLEHSAESLRDRVRDILKSGRRRTK
jgi:hypothetical protein